MALGQAKSAGEVYRADCARFTSNAMATHLHFPGMDRKIDTRVDSPDLLMYNVFTHLGKDGNMNTIEQLRKAIVDNGLDNTDNDEIIGAVDHGTHWTFASFDDNENVYFVSEFWKQHGDFSGAPRFTTDNAQDALEYLTNLPVQPNVDDYRRLGTM